MLLPALIVRLVAFCTRHAWSVIVIGMLLAVAASVHSVHKFAINSDINTLLSPNLDWRKREIAFEHAFGRFQLIVAVVEAPTPELATEATAELAKALTQNKTRFREVKQSGGGAEFFARHALMFQSAEEVQKNLEPMGKAEPLIRDLATDQSLRGLVAGMEDALLGVRDGSIKLDDTARVFNMASDTLDAVLAGRPANFSWRVLVEGRPAKPNDLRGFIEIKPVLDYGALEPGRAATDAIRQTASEILPKYQARMNLTGPVPMADEEFATIKEDAVRNGLITVGIVLIILWLALRSKRLILAVFLNLYVGLALTASLGLMLVGALNLISVYFAVLYVGIGVDFGIQYSVRYRAERYENNDLKTAILEAARNFGAPLTLAAGATAAGFLSFLPTHYTGVSELGLIAGLGMLIAFATSITFLPAMIQVLNPPGEPEPLGFLWLAPVDEFLERRRTAILVGTVAIVVGGLPLFYWLHFDFNPVNLRSPETESVATYLDLSRDPDTNPNTIGVLAPSLKEADESAARLAKVPEVSRTVTLSSFVPDRQPEKLGVIAEAAKTLEGAFDPKNAQEPPNDAENVEALNEGAERLNDVVKDQKSGGPGVDAAKRLSGLLTKLAQATPEGRRQAEIAFLPPLKTALNGLQNALHPGPVTLQSLPADLVREWLTPDGQARVSVAPRDSSSDNEAMRRFARAALAVEPRAIEGPISILEAGNTVVRAFVEAGFWALVSIALLLWIVLRRIGDVMLTLIPLIVAAAVTLELTVLVDLPMNFANIIALPLLLGVGVAFKIYYIMAWREGQTNLLQTSLTRAVIFSALTTATAFGSLWFSSHPGTASMGKLLALSLICTLAAAVLFQPVLMGKPRTPATDAKA
jgi:hopanoid biosynthesis associated RND transporter like protein HpnN